MSFPLKTLMYPTFVNCSLCEKECRGAKMVPKGPGSEPVYNTAGDRVVAAWRECGIPGHLRPVCSACTLLESLQSAGAA